MTDFFLDQLAQICKQYPDADALWQCEQEPLTYSDLWTRIQHLGCGLHKLGVEPGDRIAIAYERSQEFVLAVLACWYVGAVWMPIGGLPTERKQQLQAQSQAKWVLGPEDILLEALFVSNTECDLHAPVRLAPESPAYLIFTSGSSGQPKGVLIPHGGIVKMLQAQIVLFELRPGDRSLWVLSPLFDASVSDIGSALLSAACLVIDAEPFRSLNHFYHLIERFQIQYLDLPPALLKRLDLARIHGSLRTVTIGGEVADFQQLQKWSQALRLINVYGPTEATVCTSAHRWRQDDLAANLGQTLPGVRYGIDGPELQDGQQGELWIHSEGLALTYWQNEDLSKSRFVERGGLRWYRSGDRVKFEQGQFLFCGRLDRQFKFLGRLICPEEIEQALTQLPGIEQACVGLSPSGVLLACLKGQRHRKPELQDALQKILPRWMIPTRFVWPEPWLCTASGKPDIRALLSQDYAFEHSDQELSSQTGLDLALECVISLWQELFPERMITHGSDFFELGGSSIDVLSCVARAAESGLYLNPESFYRKGQLAQIVLDSRQSQTMSSTALKSSLSPLLSQASERVKVTHIKNLFLTGATGFLGSRLLAEILLQTDWQIHCLVRAHNEQHACSRINSALLRWQSCFDAERIHVICGDLTHDNDWQDLHPRPDAVLHCAAQVDLVRDYQSLRVSNVDSLLPLLSLNCPMHFVSSLSVIVSAQPRPPMALEAEDLDQTQSIEGGYAQSKWAAEWLLRQSRSEKDTWIYRPGLITMDSHLGMGPDKDWFSWLIQGLLKIGALPNIQDRRWAIDITPVEYVARSIVYLMTSPAGTYHLANPVSLSLVDLLCWLSQAFDLPILGTQQWQIRAHDFLRARPEPRLSAAILALCQILGGAYWHSLDLFQATGIQLASDSTRRILEHARIVCPAADQKLLEFYFDCLK